MVDKETTIYDQKLYYNWSQTDLNIIETLNSIKEKCSTTINLTVLSGKWNQMNLLSRWIQWIQGHTERASTQLTVLLFEWGDEWA